MVASILPIWFFAVYLGLGAWRHGRLDLREDLSFAVQAQLNSLDQEIAGEETALRLLAAAPSLQRGDFAAFQRQAAALAALLPEHTVTLLAANGRPLLDSRGSAFAPGAAAPPYFTPSAVAADLSPLYHDPADGTPSVALTLPVRREGRLLYVLALSCPSRLFLPYIHEPGSPASWIGAIIDQSGTVLARVRQPDLYVGHPAAAQVLRALRGPARQGVAEFVNLEGETILAAYRRSARSGWSMVVAVRQVTLESDLRHWLIMTALGGLSLLLFTALAVLLLWRAFAATERARRRQEILLRHASDGVHILDAVGTVLDASDSFAQMLGYQRHEVIGMTVGQWDAGFTPQELAAVVAEHLTDQDGRSFETRHRRKDGSVLDVEVTSHALELDGQPILFCASRDISERKTAERAMREANAELEQFAYIASHDLREPLRSISTYITLIERNYAQAFDAEGQTFLGIVRDGARRMNRMVLDLLEFTQVGRSGTQCAPLPLQEALDAALANLDQTLRETGAAFLQDRPLPVVMGNRTELTSLLQNLIGNALKYRDAARTPQVRLTLRDEPEGWHLAVADNGIGIEPEYFEQIFVIFQRLHNRELYPGTGIGLAICRRIVNRHGGRIWVESTPGQGSIFHFTLPKGDLPADGDHAG